MHITIYIIDIYYTVLGLQALTFATILPMVIGHRVPEDDFKTGTAICYCYKLYSFPLQK